MSVSRAVAEGPDGLEIVPTKTRQPHRVELDDGTVAALRRHRRAVLDRAVAAGVSLGRDAFVFMATEMLAAGVPIPIVSARLAHARASTTLNVYARAVPGGDRYAAERLAALVRSAAADLAAWTPPVVSSRAVPASSGY